MEHRAVLVRLSSTTYMVRAMWLTFGDSVDNSGAVLSILLSRLPVASRARKISFFVVQAGGSVSSFLRKGVAHINVLLLLKRRRFGW